MVNSHTADSQARPAVDVQTFGRYVVVGESSGQDGSGYGIFARRFASSGLTAGLLVLRFLFGFRAAALVGGAVDVNACTRCDPPAIEAYLLTLL